MLFKIDLSNYYDAKDTSMYSISITTKMPAHLHVNITAFHFFLGCY